jgi:hypothetical protein
MSYKTGKSGNPVGRPRGKLQRSLTREAIIREWGSLEKFFDHVVTEAKGGCQDAMRFILSRVEAPLKQRSTPMELEVKGDSAKEFTSGVLSAVSNAEIAPDEAASLLNAINQGSQLEKLEDMEAQLRRLLEAKNG